MLGGSRPASTTEASRSPSVGRLSGSRRQVTSASSNGPARAAWPSREFHGVGRRGAADPSAVRSRAAAEEIGVRLCDVLEFYGRGEPVASGRRGRRVAPPPSLPAKASSSAVLDRRRDNRGRAPRPPRRRPGSCRVGRPGRGSAIGRPPLGRWCTTAWSRAASGCGLHQARHRPRGPRPRRNAATNASGHRRPARAATGGDAPRVEAVEYSGDMHRLPDPVPSGPKTPEVLAERPGKRR